MRNFSELGNQVHKEEEVRIMTFYLIFWEVEDFQWEAEDFRWEVYLFRTRRSDRGGRGYTIQVMEEAEGRMLNKIDKDNNNQKFWT